MAEPDISMLACFPLYLVFDILRAKSGTDRGKEFGVNVNSAGK